MTNRVGQQMGNYRLIRLLGQGGFAEVYLGEHIHLNTMAAVKVLHTQLASDDLEGFRAEARTIARLEHPHIVRVLEFGIEASTPFLAMSYALNGTLRQRHPRGTSLPLEIIVSYTKQVADALQYAHDEKLIHRDIKPENMLLGRRNEVLLSDFGIALVAQSSRYQNTQEVIGTVAYMAPEQLQGKPRPASDQYALGIVVYEWLCGSRPFHGSFTEMYSQHMFVPPPPLRQKFPALSPDIEMVVLTALAKDPQRRFLSVQAFAAALEQAYTTTLRHPFAPPSQPLQPNVVHSPSSQSLPPTILPSPSNQTLQPTVAATPPSQLLQPTYPGTHPGAPPYQQTSQQWPGYPSMPPQQPRKSNTRLIIISSIALGIVIILGTIFASHPGTTNSPPTPATTPTISAVTPTNGVPTTSPSIVTINQTVIYAGVAITIESVQQATSFTDDTVPSTANGVVRVKYKEANNSGQDVVYFASQIDHLILPDKSRVDPLNEQKDGGGGIQNGVTRENWVDFAVPTSDKIAQLTLVIGTSQDAQISIPLTGNANLSAFQDKTVNLNSPISYQGLNYTLQSATASLSIAGKQASTGMRYVILTFKVDNPTSNDKSIGSTQDYMRLQAGGVTNTPVNTTLPFSANANTSGATGTVAFLMPDNNTAYTLIFLAVQGYSNVQVTTNFTI